MVMNALKEYKRAIFIVAVIIVVVLVPFFKYIPTRSHWSTPVTPVVLQEKLAQEGCFYNKAEECYQISGVDFGGDLSKTTADLGLKKWYTKDRRDSFQNLDNGSKHSVSTMLTVSAFDTKYQLSLSLYNYKCYEISFYASLTSDLKTAYPFENIMNYNNACTYFNNLYDKFVVSYGEPDKKDFPIDLTEVTLDDFVGDNKWHPGVSADWITGEKGHQSVLHLSARPDYTEDTESNQALVLRVYIDVGQEMEGVSIDDLN
jgi:hypothetical protein